MQFYHAAVLPRIVEMQSLSAGFDRCPYRQGLNINDAYKKVVSKDVRYRYVIDMSTLKA